MKWLVIIIFIIKTNLIKIRCLLNLFFFYFLGDLLTSNLIPYGVTSGLIFSTDQSALSLQIDAECIPRGCCPIGQYI